MVSVDIEKYNLECLDDNSKIIVHIYENVHNATLILLWGMNRNSV